ncbi:MAG: radical SAM family heme chaperone HemW [Candidatus Caldatribacteriaceae bacterium]
MKTLGIYVHAPFCLQKCHYCDFVSYPFKGEEKSYLRLLLSELGMRVCRDGLLGWTVQSVYFGGGTPSLCRSFFFSEFLEGLQTFFVLPPSLEVTLEANPQEISQERLEEWKGVGISRLSIGVQSFNPRYLFFLGRHSTPDALHKALCTVCESGWKNWNIDLIYGLPFQNFDFWRGDLKKAISYSPPHISIYNLTISFRVPLSPFFHRHRRLFPSLDEQCYLFRFAEEKLHREGYLHYEVSNFALPGFECRHNLLYWSNKEYIGLGPSAWTHLFGKRQKNADSLLSYGRMIQGDTLPVVFEEALSPEAKALENVILSFRTEKGILLQELQALGKEDLVEFVKTMIQEGLAKEESGRVYLSSEGLLLCNQVLGEILVRGMKKA